MSATSVNLKYVYNVLAHANMFGNTFSSSTKAARGINLDSSVMIVSFVRTVQRLKMTVELIIIIIFVCRRKKCGTTIRITSQ